MKMRLDRFFASQEIATRTEIKKMIKSSRITVNSEIVKNADRKIDTDTDKIYLDGQLIKYTPYIYIMMNKPEGIVSATRDNLSKTVLDLIPPEMKRSDLFPAGRLDKDTTGFMLITNDGNFAHDILSPKKHISKTYIAKLLNPITENDRKLFREGIDIGDEQICLCAQLDSISSDNTLVQVILYEGRYHQVKRMFAATGNKVLSLHRTMMGSLELDNTLKPGECRLLSDHELELIQNNYIK